MSLAYIGMPGPMEVVILGLFCVGVFAAIIVLVIVLVVSQKRRPDPARNPNLVPCPDCGRFVSRQAPTCPQCGSPLAPHQDS